MGKGFFHSSGGGGGYTGVGDIASGWLAWFGMRAYNAAYATGSHAAMDIVDQAGANTLTVNILSTGALDVASISAWVTAHTVTTILVTKLYDQTGNGFHLTQATVGAMPTLLLAQTIGSGSFPLMLLANGQQMLSATAPTYGTTPSFSAVLNATPVGGFTTVFGTNTGNAGGIWTTAASHVVELYSGTAATAPLTAGTWGAVQGMYNGASSSLYVNGTSTGSLSPGTFNETGVLAFGGALGGFKWGGKITEMGVIAGNLSGGNQSGVNGNQTAYYGGL